MRRLPQAVLGHVANDFSWPEAGDPRLPRRDRAVLQRRQRHLGAANEPRQNINPKIGLRAAHKLRGRWARTVHDWRRARGTVEVDGAYFGGSTRQGEPQRPIAGTGETSAPARSWLSRASAKAARCPGIVARKARRFPLIRQNVASGTEVHADEAGSWNILHASFPMKRVNHSAEFKSEDGACTNQAESFFARLRQLGVRHSSTDKWPSLAAVRERDGVAGEQPPPAQRHALEPDNCRPRYRVTSAFRTNMCRPGHSCLSPTVRRPDAQL